MSEQLRLDFVESVKYNDIGEIKRILNLNKAKSKKEFHILFLLALEYGNINIVKLFLDKKVNVNYIYEEYNKTTPLITASAYSNYETVKLLLDNGANINDKNIDGNSPLMIACENNDYETIKLLLDRGANINDKNIDAITPLMFACEHKDYETIKLLLDRGANINDKNIYSDTPLMLACEYNDYETIKLLLDRGSNANDKNDNDDTALMFACQHKDYDTIKLLLDRGANVNDKNIEDDTPLITASKYRDYETIKLLLDRGANVNDTNYDNDSSLIFTARRDDIKSVELLLERGADPFIKNGYILGICRIHGCTDLVYNYIWKNLYKRDVDTAKRYAKSTLSKDVWELILLNKRQQQLCQRLSSNKNREVLKYFAIELNIPINENMTKANLCAIISRHLAYGKYYSEAGRKYTEDKLNKDIKNVKDMASRFGLDRNKPIGELLKDLSHLLT
jgi:ankyrin repeat protein